MNVATAYYELLNRLSDSDRDLGSAEIKVKKLKRKVKDLKNEVEYSEHLCSVLQDTNARLEGMCQEKNRTIERLNDEINDYAMVCDAYKSVIDASGTQDVYVGSPYTFSSFKVGDSKFLGEVMCMAAKFVASPNKINAIKLVRILTGCGLGNSKAFIDKQMSYDKNVNNE